MLCSDVIKWLDDGMPAAGGGPAREHAETCSSCARAIATAAVVERALSAPPPAPPRGADRFVASVLESIRAEGAPRPAVERPTRPPLRRILESVLFEPAFGIGVAILVVLAFLPSLSASGAGRSLAAAAAIMRQILEGTTDQVLRAALAYPAVVATLDPTARVALIVCFLSLLVWAGFGIVDAVDQSLRRGAGRRA